TAPVREEAPRPQVQPEVPPQPERLVRAEELLREPITGDFLARVGLALQDPLPGEAGEGGAGGGGASWGGSPAAVGGAAEGGLSGGGAGMPGPGNGANPFLTLSPGPFGGPSAPAAVPGVPAPAGAAPASSAIPLALPDVAVPAGSAPSPAPL